MRSHRPKKSSDPCRTEEPSFDATLETDPNQRRIQIEIKEKKPVQTHDQTAPGSRKMLWTGRIVSALPVLMLWLSGIMKVMKPAPVVQGFAHYGYPERMILLIAFLEIASTVVYVIPRTTVLGAILMTGYLGGATASNVRIGDPSFVVTVVLGILVWLGLYLRDRRLRTLLPL